MTHLLSLARGLCSLLGHGGLSLRFFFFFFNVPPPPEIYPFPLPAPLPFFRPRTGSRRRWGGCPPAATAAADTPTAVGVCHPRQHHRQPDAWWVPVPILGGQLRQRYR